MKSIEELNDLMIELLENTKGKTVTFNDRAREIIDEVSDFAEQTGLYQAAKQKGIETFDGEPAEKIYLYLLNRIVNAPGAIFRNGSVLLIMPHLRNALSNVHDLPKDARKEVGSECQILCKWNYETHAYHRYEIPAEWDVRTYCDDMSQTVNCAGCGRNLPYGETFTSLEIHTKMGIGYGVCQECNEKEWERRKRGET